MILLFSLSSCSLLLDANSFGTLHEPETKAFRRFDHDEVVILATDIILRAFNRFFFVTLVLPLLLIRLNCRQSLSLPIGLTRPTMLPINLLKSLRVMHINTSPTYFCHGNLVSLYGCLPQLFIINMVCLVSNGFLSHEQSACTN